MPGGSRLLALLGGSCIANQAFLAPHSSGSSSSGSASSTAAASWRESAAATTPVARRGEATASCISSAAPLPRRSPLAVLPGRSSLLGHRSGCSAAGCGVFVATIAFSRRHKRRWASRLKALPAGIAIVGFGSAAPESVVSNDNLSEIIDTSDEWIVQRTGIRRRHILKPGESLASLSALAARRALEDAKMAPEEVELVILATSTPDDLFGSAPTVASQIGATNAVAFDLTAACSGFVFALSTAAQYVRTGAVKSAVVVGADCLSRFVDWEDRGTCILFGDGAGAVAVRAVEPEKDALIGFDLGSDGRGACHLGLPFDVEPVSLGAGASGGSASVKKLGMNGKEVFRFATSRVPEVLRRLLDRHDVSSDEVDWLLLHQANRRIMDSAAKKLGIAKEKIICNLDEYGNTSAASIPLALHEAIQSGQVKPGQLIACCGFGAGLSWGGMLLRL